MLTYLALPISRRLLHLEARLWK